MEPSQAWEQLGEAANERQLRLECSRRSAALRKKGSRIEDICVVSMGAPKVPEGS